MMMTIKMLGMKEEKISLYFKKIINNIMIGEVVTINNISFNLNKSNIDIISIDVLNSVNEVIENFTVLSEVFQYLNNLNGSVTISSNDFKELINYLNEDEKYNYVDDIEKDFFENFDVIESLTDYYYYFKLEHKVKVDHNIDKKNLEASCFYLSELIIKNKKLFSMKSLYEFKGKLSRQLILDIMNINKNIDKISLDKNNFSDILINYNKIFFLDKTLLIKISNK